MTLGSSRVARFGRVLLLATVLLGALGLLFRATLYWSLPVAPGDPYGIADVIELLNGYLLMGLSCALIPVGLVLIIKRSVRSPRLGVACLALAASVLFGYGAAHDAVSLLHHP